MASGYYIGQHIFRSLKIRTSLDDNRNTKSIRRPKKKRKFEKTKK